MHVSDLYEPLISREIDAFVARAREFRKEHDQREYFDAVTRFAVLSYSPSQHGKHALLAPLAAHDVANVFDSEYDDILAECAIYAAQSRQPWSEPPITDPPAVDDDDPWSLEDIRGAIEAGDRLQGERWLARRMKEPDLARDFFEIACEDFADFGHKLIVAVACWRLADMYPDVARFGILRNAVVEWTAYSEKQEIENQQVDLASLLDGVIGHIDAEEGAIDAFHLLALFDAGISASSITGEARFEQRVASYLRSADLSSAVPRTSRPQPRRAPPNYRLARDCAEYLKACAIRERLKDRFPNADFDRVIAATRYNLDHGPSMEEWSFA